MSAVPSSPISPELSLFEIEMRSQVESAEAAVLEACQEGDPIVVDMARSHLDGLISLARRNGLDIESSIPAETVIAIDTIDLTVAPEARSA
jgi:hypothetical protein